MTCFAFACQGIYIGDITDAHSLSRPMRGAKALVILTSSYPLKDPNGTWYFPEGNYPIDIDWKGSNNQARECCVGKGCSGRAWHLPQRASEINARSSVVGSSATCVSSISTMAARSCCPATIRCLCIAIHSCAAHPAELLPASHAAHLS